MTNKMPCHITDGLQDDDDEMTGYCVLHEMAFTDWCEACDEERLLELRREREREIADETVEVLRDIGKL